MNNKIVYLLGAGAMLDFGAPTTHCLTEECKSILQNKDFNGIIDLLDKTYGAEVYNFETIIAYVEYLLDWTLANEKIGANVQSRNIISSIFYPQIENIKSESAFDLFKCLINRLVDFIKHYDFLNAENENQRLLQKYLSMVNKNNNVKIYSLNYDRLIPLLFDKINDGTIDVHQLDKPFEYNIQSYVNDKFTYFNLHGSIYLKQIPNSLYDVYQSLSPEPIKYCLPQKGGSPNDEKIFSPIIAGYSKCQRILSEPFHFGFSSFCADCSDCERLIIVGYSFSDPHINSILKNYVSYKRKQMDIVDYNGNGDYHKITEHLTYPLNYREGFTPKPDGAKSQNVTIYMRGFINYMKDFCQL